MSKALCGHFSSIKLLDGIFVNLTYVSDPLPFQWLAKPEHRFSDVIFIDLDFPSLLEEKARIIAANPPLHDLLGQIQQPDSARQIHYAAEHYFAIGCDLGNLGMLDEALAGVIDLSTCLVLCTAEVSMTYMPAVAASNLIFWAARRENSESPLILRGHAQ